MLATTSFAVGAAVLLSASAVVAAIVMPVAPAGRIIMFVRLALCDAANGIVMSGVVVPTVTEAAALNHIFKNRSAPALLLT